MTVREIPELWTNDYIVSRLKLRLGIVELSNNASKTDLLETGKQFDSRKYYNQAYHYLRVGVCNPIPNFLISLVDLGPTLIKELAQLEKQDRDFVVKQAVGRIFEDISSELYHDSVSKVLKVKIVK